MESQTQHAPPVVAVVVINEPGDWFDETLDALADQDYPNLRFLFLATTSADALVDEAADMSRLAELETTIKMRLPNAFVRSIEANPGFGPAASEVLRLVEGQNGFFLICHDDVAPERDAVRLMVEEIYRSNAGAVGPKFVEWDDPGVLQSVGLGLDRFGVIDQPIEPDEVDQEQHDGVRDVFVLPSAFLLVRADLFRELDGFDPAIDFYGDDVELCWRVHHSGARVVVAPTAKVRHRNALPERRADLNVALLEARHRMRTVTTLTSAARLPLRLFELTILTFAELVVGLFTGRFRQALASLRALFGLLPRIPSILARRREVKAIRRVPEREVLGLQERGSSRISSFLRSRETATFVGADTSVRRWRESTTAPVIAWLAVLAAILIGSRSLLGGGIPAVGEFLRFPESPGGLFDAYVNGWNPNGTGGTSPNPTGWATLAGLSVFTLFRMGLLHTAFIIGLIIVGLIGQWRLATVFPSTRARISSLVVYGSIPLVSGSMGIGSLTTLVAYASTPWMLHTVRRAAGVATADPRLADTDIADGLVGLPLAERIRRTLQVGIVVALATAFAPVMLVVLLLVGLLLAVGTLVAMAPWRTAAEYAVVTLGGVAVAMLLNFPWITSWSWEALVGPSPIGDAHRGLLDVASFAIGPTPFAGLALVLYLPLVAAVALARAWRLTWAIRAAALVLGFGALAVLGDAGSLPVQPPEAGVLLAPVAVGLAIAAAAAVAAFDLDVRGGSFGWRQPLGLAASAAVAIGVVPGALALGDGAWGAPSTPLSRLIEFRLPDVPTDAESNYHVLLLGDARLLPVPSVEYRDGIAYGLMSDAPLDTRDRWEPITSRADDAIVAALDELAVGSTQRAGKLLAPLGIRFIVIPLIDDVVSTTEEPLDVPVGLVDALERQLDIVSLVGLPTVEFYENTSWIPAAAVLTGETAEASRSAGAAALLRADLTNATPVFVGADHLAPSTDEVSAGVVHIAVPFDDNWRLTVDGESIDARTGFGSTTAFDVPRGGSATLSYSTPPIRGVLVAFQVVVWLVALFGATRVVVPIARRRDAVVSDETLITLDESVGDAASFDPGLDMTGQIVRADDDTGRDEAVHDDASRLGDAVADTDAVADVDLLPGDADVGGEPDLPWADVPPSPDDLRPVTPEPGTPAPVPPDATRSEE